jgi:hypothetical protein
MKSMDDIQKSKSGKRARRKGLDNEKRLVEKLSRAFPSATLGPPSGAKGGDFEHTNPFQFEAKKSPSLPASPEKALAQAEGDAQSYIGADIPAVILSNTAPPGGRVQDRVYLDLDDLLDFIAATGTAKADVEARAPEVDWEPELRELFKGILKANSRRTIYGQGNEKIYDVSFRIPTSILERLGETLGMTDGEIEKMLG